MDFSGTFDTTNALAGIFIWLIFGMMTRLLNCDIQRLLDMHPIILHAFALLAFFFLFTLLDTNNKTSIANIFIKTFFVYILFVLMTKSKWYFVLPALSLLLIDQLFKKNVAIKETSGEKVDEIKKTQEMMTKIINIAIIFLIIIGTLDYMRLQYIEYKEKFSFKTFFWGVNKKCKKNMPTYK